MRLDAPDRGRRRHVTPADKLDHLRVDVWACIVQELQDQHSIGKSSRIPEQKLALDEWVMEVVHERVPESVGGIRQNPLGHPLDDPIIILTPGTKSQFAVDWE